MIHSFPKIWHLGTKNVANIFDSEVEITEKVDGCVGMGSHILMSDLSYKKAMFVCVGDEVVGFDDHTNNPRLKKALVTRLHSPEHRKQ